MLEKVFMVMVVVAALGVIWLVLYRVIYDIFWRFMDLHIVDVEELVSTSIEYTNKMLALIGAIYIAVTVLNRLLGL